MFRPFEILKALVQTFQSFKLSVAGPFWLLPARMSNINHWSTWCPGSLKYWWSLSLKVWVFMVRLQATAIVMIALSVGYRHQTSHIMRSMQQWCVCLIHLDTCAVSHVFPNLAAQCCCNSMTGTYLFTDFSSELEHCQTLTGLFERVSQRKSIHCNLYVIAILLPLCQPLTCLSNAAQSYPWKYKRQTCMRRLQHCPCTRYCKFEY